MIAKSQIWHWLTRSLLAGGLLLLVACSEDPEEQPKGDHIQLLTTTRASGSYPSDEGNYLLKMYIAPATSEGTMKMADYSYSSESSRWTSSSQASISEDTQYYIYGYMRTDANTIQDSKVTVSAPDGGYANGINITMSDLPAITDDDICLVVGVQRVSDPYDSNEGRVCVPEVLVEGKYGYFSGVRGENFVNLLMDHLYSQLVLKFTVDADYSKLRRIKLKELTLTAAETVTAEVNIRSNSGIGSPTYTPGSSTIAWLIFSDEGGVELGASPSVTDLTARYCAPSIFSTETTLVSTYDVYDRQGNLIREGCTATNKFSIGGMEHGVKKTLTLTVVPTYLYVLGDPDLDNPTIEVK
jgi:hypothetical protein